MRRDAAANRGNAPFLVTNIQDADDRRALAAWVRDEVAAARAAL